MAEKGSLSINSENIFPIIKKWMYSDQDIFVREQISNASDAVTKLEKLSLIGEWKKPEGYRGRIDVIVDSEKKTISFRDNGIGMTKEEIEKYINQIAFSGATDFIEKYKDKANEEQIIGHFGLGFYSAFMVADLVEIETLSYREGAKPVHWSCSGGTGYEIREGERKENGTSVILHLNEDCLKYANEWEIRTVLEKYCSFMPVEIYLTKLPKDAVTIPAAEKRDGDVVLEEIPEKTEKDADGKEKKLEAKLRIEKRPELVNEIHPLWGKNPSDCTKEEYLDFYRKVFHDYREPLFWIHLNMDYPYNLKGILYFPKINTEYESIEGTIKLYNNQVFIADNIKEVIPEYLLLLKGAIDCPDLPLNVSRSQLQNDGFVKKISDYITKKVADKLSGLCKTERESYEKYWDDIAPFIKYGCLRDQKFCERMTNYILFKDIDDKYLLLPECLDIKGSDSEAKDTEAAEGLEKGEDKKIPLEEKSGENGEKEEAQKPEAEKEVKAAEAGEGKSEGEKEESKEEKSSKEEGSVKSGEEDAASSEAEKKDKTIFYVTDPLQQSQYIAMFRQAGKDAVLLTERIDQPFITELEAKNPGIHFKRIDADLESEFGTKLTESEEKELSEKAAELEKSFRESLKKEKLRLKLQKMNSPKTAAFLSISEEGRRMNDMMRMYAMQGMSMGEMPVEETLLLNAEHPLVKHLLSVRDTEDGKLIEKQLYDLAKLQQAPLSASEMADFIERSNSLLLRIKS